MVYCCTESCLTIASALGNALAYADKAEAVFALLAIAAYLLFFRTESRSLRITIKDIFSASMNSQTLGNGAQKELLKFRSLRADKEDEDRSHIMLDVTDLEILDPNVKEIVEKMEAKMEFKMKLRDYEREKELMEEKELRKEMEFKMEARLRELEAKFLKADGSTQSSEFISTAKAPKRSTPGGWASLGGSKVMHSEDF